MFQAFRSYHAPIDNKITSQCNLLKFLLNNPLYRVPCAPARSDFATALEDVKRAEKDGHFVQILVVEGEK